ncbi:MAG: EamA family transporter, partial [Eubacterium sp.]|nr:EamA family transporter [Eubacterium sp.]
AVYPISEISIFNALIPVLGVIFSSVLLKEELKWQYICSVIIVGIGIYLVNMRRKKPAE